MGRHEVRGSCFSVAPVEFRMAMWFQINPNDFTYDVSTTAVGVGYCIKAWPRGHMDCECMRSREVSFWYRSHNMATGEFPNVLPVREEYDAWFREAHPELETTQQSSIGYLWHMGHMVHGAWRLRIGPSLEAWRVFPRLGA